MQDNHLLAWAPPRTLLWKHSASRDHRAGGKRLAASSLRTPLRSRPFEPAWHGYFTSNFFWHRQFCFSKNFTATWCQQNVRPNCQQQYLFAKRRDPRKGKRPSQLAVLLNLRLWLSSWLSSLTQLIGKTQTTTVVIWVSFVTGLSMVIAFVYYNLRSLSLPHL